MASANYSWGMDNAMNPFTIRITSSPWSMGLALQGVRIVFPFALRTHPAALFSASAGSETPGAVGRSAAHIALRAIPEALTRLSLDGRRPHDVCETPARSTGWDMAMSHPINFPRRTGQGSGGGSNGKSPSGSSCVPAVLSPAGTSLGHTGFAAGSPCRQATCAPSVRRGKSLPGIN